MTPSDLCSQHEEDEMSCSPLKKNCANATLALAAVLGLLLLEGCDNPGALPPVGRRRTADPVQKVRQGVDPAKVKNPVASPGEPGKLPPGRGRAMD
jgi:hypothetical protein